jgi:hypothetical protein
MELLSAELTRRGECPSRPAGIFVLLQRQFRLLIIVFLTMIFFNSSAQNNPWQKLMEADRVDTRFVRTYNGMDVPLAEADVINRFLIDLSCDSSFAGDYRNVSEQLVSLGFVFLKRDEPDAAVIWFNRAGMIDSSNMSVYLGLGGACITKGDFHCGHFWYRTGLQQDSNHFGLLYAMGRSFMGQYLMYSQGCASDTADQITSGEAGFLDSAIHYLDKAYTHRPGHHGLLYLISSVYYCQGDCANAKRYYAECGDACRRIAPEYYHRELRKLCRRKVAPFWFLGLIEHRKKKKPNE